MKKTFSLLLLAITLRASAAVQPLALAPFTYAGRISDYDHVGYAGDAPAELRAYNTAGDLIAKATTRTSGDSAYNYVLDIPVATQDIPRYATVGESLVFEAVDPEGRVYTGLVPAKDCVVGNPGGLCSLSFVLATDSDGDGVPDEYVEMLDYLMWKNGIDAYNASEDYDGDGSSNYEEFVAGTNPFDETDRLAILDFAMLKGDFEYVSLGFIANQGRSYAVETTPSLEHPAWVKADFSLTPAGASQLRLNTGSSEVGYKTVYLILDDGASRFWRLTVE